MAKYTLNECYFNEIDSADKAYWLGFIWGDGYVYTRERGTSTSYEFKLSLSDVDQSHLELFKKHISSTHEIRNYNMTGFKSNHLEARLYISNKKFVQVLYYIYGIMPHRDDFSTIIKIVPERYYRDLIRGLIDSDGCITSKDIQYKTRKRKEYSLGLISNISVLDFFNEQLLINKLTTTKYAQTKRHKGRDGLVKNIRITGNKIVLDILNWIYKDSKCISLDRKYKKYEEIVQYMDEYGRGNVTYDN